jgi:fibronectin type 3 domain-containing protein
MRFPTRPWAWLFVAAPVAAISLAVPSAAQSGPDFPISAGTSTAAFGPSIGLDFRAGVLHAAWADTRISGSDDVELAAARVSVGADGSVSVGPTVNVSNAAGGQAGASLARDPTAAGRVLAVANSFGATPGILRARSVDGGAMWSATTDSTGEGFGSASPQIACDGFGNCFLGFLDQTDPFNPQLRLSLSTDGGESFSPLAIPDTPGFEPGLALTVGPGSVWLVFEHYDTAPRVKTLAARVTGLGAVGPFTVQPVPSSFLADSPDIAIGPSGAALVVTEHIPNGSAAFIESHVDPDGLGPAGFGAPLTVTNVVGYPQFPKPQVAWDGVRGRAYLVYRDQEFDSQSRDVLLRFSDDAGATWSAAIRVNAHVFSQDRPFPNVAVDPSTGHVGVAWYDFREGAARLFGRVFASVERPAEPGSPVNLRATPVSRSQIDLVWEDRSDNETGFEITRTSAAGVQTLLAGPDATSFSDTGLAESTQYTYVVRAVNAAGSSTATNQAAATTLATPPSTPTNLVALGGAWSNRIELTWDASARAAGYEIHQSTAGGAFVHVRNSTTNAATIYSLEPGVVYSFKVRAFNSGGLSDFSNVASSTTELAPPATPTDLTAVAVASFRIDLAWSDRSPVEDRFDIAESRNGNSFRVVATVNPNTTSFSRYGLRAGTTYVYRVRACNAAGCSAWSNTATATTPRR